LIAGIIAVLLAIIFVLSTIKQARELAKLNE
jgi:hypothetical protein